AQLARHVEERLRLQVRQAVAGAEGIERGAAALVEDAAGIVARLQALAVLDANAGHESETAAATQPQQQIPVLQERQRLVEAAHALDGVAPQQQRTGDDVVILAEAALVVGQAEAAAGDYTRRVLALVTLLDLDQRLIVGDDGTRLVRQRRRKPREVR